MAAAQSRSKQAQRMSTGGRDILSRMLMMERQSKNKRASSTSPISYPEGQSEDFEKPALPTSPTSRLDIQPSPSPNSLPTHPALIPRSETWPILGEAQTSAAARPAKTPLKIETAKVKDEVAPNEICLSPSWPDHSEKKRRKEKKQKDKEQKELDKKIKEYSGMKRELSKKVRKEEEKEKQRAADVKAGKRLSKKPPPAAMETQKMPVGLRRSSFASMFSSRPSSREGSRRNSMSGDEKRLSGISLSSFTTERSQSTPATSDEAGDSFDRFRSTVSPTPPQLPSFGWKSRRGSNETSRGVSWVSEDAYDKEVVEFAYRLDASAFVIESEKIEKKRSQNEQRQPRKSHFKEHTEGHTFTRSTTEPILASSKQVSTTPKAPPRSPKRLETKQKDSSTPASAMKKEAETTIRTRSPKSVHPALRNGHAGGEPPVRAVKDRPAKSPDAFGPQHRPAMQSRSSHDGSSYVQKQRMYQQQMSIASFEEQQTVQDAYELAAENEKPVGAQGHDFNPTSEQYSATPTIKATTPPIHQFNHQDSAETIVSLTHDSQARRADSPQSELPSAIRPQKSTPLIQSTKAVDVPESPKPDVGVVNATQPPKPAVPDHTQPPASSKSDKILGFRKRSKPPPSKIWISEEEKPSTSHQHPMSAPPTQTAEPASKRSMMEKMLIDPLAAQMTFKKRSGSAGSATLTPPPKELFRTHTRNRTNSSEALTADLPSPVPWSGPINTPKSRQGKVKEPVMAAKKDPIPPEEKRSELAANTSRSRRQSSDGIGNPPSHSTSAQPVIINGKSEDVVEQPSPAIEEQKIPEVKELIRYELVETIEPRAVTSKAKSPVTAEPPAASSPAVSASTPSSPKLADPSNATKAEPEVPLSSTNSEGMIRKSSMTRPRSISQLQTQTTTTAITNSSLPSLDFLPQLKHQPLVKRTSPPRQSSTDSPIPPFPQPPPSPGSGTLGSLSSSPANSRLLLASTTTTAAAGAGAGAGAELPAILPRSPLRPSASPTIPLHLHHPLSAAAATVSAPSLPIFTPNTTPNTLTLPKVSETAAAKPVAKLFTICCTCHYWLDLPSKLYEAMMISECGTTEKVICPWCKHKMTTKCCSGWTAVVSLHKKHH